MQSRDRIVRGHRQSADAALIEGIEAFIVAHHLHPDHTNVADWWDIFPGLQTLDL